MVIVQIRIILIKLSLKYKYQNSKFIRKLIRNRIRIYKII
jgi:hypothetical protein